MLRKYRLWLGFGISMVFIALFFRNTDLGKIVDALRGADYVWFVPAVGIYIASLGVRALRYQILVRDLKRIPAWQLFPVICIAFMANNLIPARAGELVRAYIMGEKYGIKKVSALGTVLVERLFDGLTLLLFLLVTVAVLGSNGTLQGLAQLSVVVFLAGLTVFGAILMRPQLSERLLHRLIELAPAKLRPLGRDLVSSLIDGMTALRHPDALLAVAICSPLAWLMEAGVFWFVGRSFGLHYNLGWFMMAMAAGNLALTVPSTQGGLGPFEFFAKNVIVLAGASEGVAAAYTLAVHAMIILPVTLLGLVFLSVINVSLSRAVHGDATEAGPSSSEPPPPPMPLAPAIAGDSAPRYSPSHYAPPVHAAGEPAKAGKPQAR